MAPTRLNEQLRAFLESLTDESNRGLALVSGEHVHSAIGDLLRQAFIKSGLKEHSFGPRGFLWDFDAKSRCAYLMGLLRKRAHGIIDAVRELRNLAGHTREPFDLGKPAPLVQKQLDRLPPFNGLWAKRNGEAVLVGTEELTTDPEIRNRWRIISATMGVSWYLDDTRQKLERVDAIEAGELPLLLVQAKGFRLHQELKELRERRLADAGDGFLARALAAVDPPDGNDEELEPT